MSYAQDQEQLIAVAKAVLDQNMREYNMSLLCMDQSELIAKSAEIVAMQETHYFMKFEYQFKFGDAETLLRMENPLRFVAEQWPSDIPGLFEMSGHVSEAIEKAAKVTQRGERSSAQEKAAAFVQSEKPSIRGQLRNTVRDTGQSQHPEGKAMSNDAR